MGETGEDGLQLHARDVVPFAARGEEDRGFARTSGSCATGNLA
jgi:hypothetical protein